MRRTTKLWVPALLLALCGVGCGGNSTPQADLPPPLLEGPAADALPRPADLVQILRGTSAVEDDVNRNGSATSPLIASNRTLKAGSTLKMSPAVFPGNFDKLAYTSYALYDFPIGSYTLDPVLDLDWARPPAGPGVVYAGLANFEQNRWDWFSTTPLEQLVLPTFEPYLSQPDGHLLVVVIATGFDEIVLSHVRVGRDYDEFESAFDVDNILPEGDVSGYTGSLGKSFVYKGYDGDDRDGFLIYGKPGDTLSVTVEYKNVTADLSMRLIDFEGDELTTTSGDSPLTIARTMITGNNGPYYLYVEADSGHSDYTLSKSIEYAPDVLVDLDQWHGPVPLNVNFDASASSDRDGSITNYEWDWDGDGTYDASGSSPLESHSYAVQGNYRPTVRLTDNDGRKSRLALSVTAGGSPTYDEVEDNDVRGALPSLPTAPFEDYRGSVGTDPGYPGYDGDTTDGYLFFPQPGQELVLSLSYDPLTAPDMALQVYEGGLILSHAGELVTPGLLSVSLRRSSVDRLPYLVVIYTDGYSDYSLSAQTGLAPLGYLQLSPPLGVAPLSVDFDAGGSADNGSIVNYEWDWNGDSVFDQSTGGLPEASHDFAAAGNYTVNLRLTDDEGNQSVVSQLLYVWPSTYNEREPNNDSINGVQSLPALPVNNFRGNLGAGPYAGYDGGRTDYFYIEGLEEGDTVTVTIDSDETTGDMWVDLRDYLNSTSYDSSGGDTGTEQLVHLLDGSEDLPLLLLVSVFEGGYTNYSIDVSKS